MKKDKNDKMEKIMSLCKRRGFIFQSGDLYGGLNGCWDYGFLGVELKKNLKDYWWRIRVQCREDIVGLDGAILTHREALKASGHVDTFNDPMIDCKTCKGRFRADNLDVMECPQKPSVNVGKGKNCELTEAKEFNLMLKTYLGATSKESDKNALAYLRPETAQTIFLQFKNTLDSARVKLPFGIAQIGKAFRNEINPRNFTFRSREFEQMEIEYFCKPEDGLKLTEEWLKESLDFYKNIGLDGDKLHVLDVPEKERAHYSEKTYDIEYDFPFGRQELEGVAYRTDYDLSKHQEHSKKSLEYFDEESREKFIPHVVEPSAGVDRTVLALITTAYCEEKLEKDSRVVLKFHPRMAPVKLAILPLVKNKEEIVKLAKNIQNELMPAFNVVYDQTGAVGRRYRRQDEIGTPYCLTVDFDSLDDGMVTIRERDSMEQSRVKIADVKAYILDKIF